MTNKGKVKAWIIVDKETGKIDGERFYLIRKTAMNNKVRMCKVVACEVLYDKQGV